MLMQSSAPLLLLLLPLLLLLSGLPLTAIGKPAERLQVADAEVEVEAGDAVRGLLRVRRSRRSASAIPPPDGSPALGLPGFGSRAFGQAKTAFYAIRPYGIAENASCSPPRPCEGEGGMGEVKMINQLEVKGGRKVPYWRAIVNDDPALFGVDRYTSSVTVSRPGRYLISAILSFNQVAMTRDIFVKLLVNGTDVMSRRFDERLFCSTMQLLPEDPNPQLTREKCLKRNIQAQFFYQGAFNGPVTIALGTSVSMGANMPIFTADWLTHLVVTRLGGPLREKQPVKAA